MKTLYLDIFSGISGDMFLGAMIDLGVDAQELQTELQKLKLGEDWHMHVHRARKSHIEGVKFDVHGSHCHDHDLNHSHEEHSHSKTHDHGGDHHDHFEGQTHGPHGGPLVQTKSGRVELSVFETNVPPRFRLYFFDAHGHATKPAGANAVNLTTLRIGRKRQSFKFKAVGDYLEATVELPEPHEFVATLELKRGGKVEKIKTQFIEEHHHHDQAPQHAGHSHDHIDHNHDHGGHDEHHHEHGRNFADIKHLIQSSSLSRWVKEKSVAVFHRVAVAEGKIHGHPAEEVHFHEVGALDSIIDIVGSCIALELLGKPRILAAQVVEGTGWVNCAHGRFPVPTMATLSILGARGIAVSQCEEPHELVTPTGAALLAEFVESFGPMTGLVAEHIGYGLGTRDNKTRPNVLRAVLGRTEAISDQLSVTSSTNATRRPSLDWETDSVAILETNLDDCTAELLGFVMERVFAFGALDAFHTPVQMKKNRPGVLLSVLCAPTDSDKLTELLLRETTAFGVRRSITERRKLKREVVRVETRHGEIEVKVGRLNGQVIQAAPEFESCKAAALKHGVPFQEVFNAAKKVRLPRKPNSSRTS
ncbi:MAG: nickel pincer cofactor biosynthesis protein LarC [Pedosphaera sp.]|nr:nickel pincer cofactor biosynthesis protein LarC [Pedosphaera sp.]